MDLTAPVIPVDVSRDTCTEYAGSLGWPTAVRTYLQPHNSISLKNLSDFGEVSRIVLHLHQGKELLSEDLWGKGIG